MNKTRIKHISTDCQSFQKCVNEILLELEQEKFNVKDIKYSTCVDGQMDSIVFSAIIIYEKIDQINHPKFISNNVID